MPILSKQGVTAEMQFKCTDCQDTISGQAVIDGEYLYIVQADRVSPMNSAFRCECCQDDMDDRND
jgi:hypothetical protein